MVTPSYTIACTYKELKAPLVYELRFDKPQGFTFKAGQFVLFDVPLVENMSDLQPRAYSIASSPSETELIFIIKITPGGRTSRWIEEVLTIGTTVAMKGPFGLFTINTTNAKPLLFIATGTGIAPFRSQVKWLLEEENYTRPLTMVFGVREKKDLFWTDEFMRLKNTFANFSFHTSLTSGESDWDGHTGRVQQIVPQVIADFSNVSVFICGAPDMVADIKKLCLETWNVPKADVHAEGYI